MGSTTNTEKVHTHGTFRYIARGAIPKESQHLYHLPPLADFRDVRSCQLHDIRPSLELGDETPYKLNKHGFTARRWPSALHSTPYNHAIWNDETALREVYVPEIEKLVLQVTGAKTVLMDLVVMRTETHTEVDKLADLESGDAAGEAKALATYPRILGSQAGGGASPAPKVHLDYTPAGARTHLRNYHHETLKRAAPVIEAEDRLLATGISPIELKHYYDGPRWAMFSIWRPLKPVKRDPIALSDVSVFPTEDYLPFPILYPSGAGIGSDGDKTHVELGYLAYGSDKHEWHWISNHQPDEVLLIQFFDSEAEKAGLGPAGGVMHSSVQLEGTESEEARESIEVRCTVLW